MMISVITWDASFRESLHTIDFFARQDLDKSRYEFIWVDFYQSNDRVKKKIAEHENARLITMDHRTDEPWHLGKCINAGVAGAKGDLLVIPDGDIAVEEDFLWHVLASHVGQKDLVVYYKRFDEPQSSSCKISKSSIDHLKSSAILTNPTNYAGCLTLGKSTFSRINGYEIHSAFAGPGINGIETYIRLRNAGCLIKWEPEVRIYHPWHPSSGSAGHNTVDLLKKVKATHPWVIPYAGLRQSWITHQREMTGEILAGDSFCEQILQKMPNIDFTPKRGFSLRSLFFSKGGP